MFSTFSYDFGIAYSRYIVVSKTFPPQSGVTIGFSTATYTVSEGVGSVSVAVFLRHGILARDVVVTLQTLDGTAMGESLCISGSTIASYMVHSIGSCEVIYNLYPPIPRWDGLSKYIH